jgi:hypothetical protein
MFHIHHPSAWARCDVAPTVAIPKLALPRTTGHIADHGAGSSTDRSANGGATNIVRDDTANHRSRRGANTRTLLRRRAARKRQACHGAQQQSIH